MDSVPAVGVPVWPGSVSLSAPANKSGLTLQKKNTQFKRLYEARDYQTEKKQNNEKKSRNTDVVKRK
jgi:hypothetical protein